MSTHIWACVDVKKKKKTTICDLIKHECITNEIWEAEGLQKSAEVKKKSLTPKKNAQEGFEIMTFL